MAFSPATQALLDQHGQGLFSDDQKKRSQAPRYARSQPPPGPNAYQYAPNNPFAGTMPQAQQQPSQNAPAPQMMQQQLTPNGVGAQQATLGAPATLSHPLINADWFDRGY